MRLGNDLCAVEICNDTRYTLNSADNPHYDLELNPLNFKKNDFYQTYSIHVEVFDSEHEITNELDIAFIGKNSICSSDCAVLENTVLTLLQEDRIFQIQVTDGTLLLQRNFECFGGATGLYRIPGGYIVQGELEILMLDEQFCKKWSFYGAHVVMESLFLASLEITENSIQIYDDLNNYYELDFEGNLINSKIVQTQMTRPANPGFLTKIYNKIKTKKH